MSEPSALLAAARTARPARASIKRLAERSETNEELHETLRSTVRDRERHAATSLACALAVRGAPIDGRLLADLAPLIDDVLLLPPLLARVADPVGTALTMLEEDRVPDERAAIAILIAVHAAPDPATRAPLLPYVRRLARSLLSVGAEDILTAAIERIDDPMLTKLAAPLLREPKQYRDDAARNVLSRFEEPMLEQLPEVEAARVVTHGEPVKRAQEKVGRNDPCPCGSGKKYKKCHGVAGEGASEPSAELVLDTAHLTPERIGEMRPIDIVTLELAKLADAALIGAFRRLVLFRWWEDAERVLALIAARPALSKQHVEEREHLALEAFRARRPELGIRIARALEAEGALTERLALQLDVHQPDGGTLARLDAAARRALDGDAELGFDLAYTILDQLPALGMLVGRGVLDPARQADSDVLLGEIESARDRLGLDPIEPWVDRYQLITHGTREVIASTVEAVKKLGDETVREKLHDVEHELAQKHADLVAMQHELRAQKEALERVGAKQATSTVEAPASAEDDAERKRLARRLEEVSALLAERNEERAALRRELAQATRSEGRAERAVRPRPAEEQSAEHDERLEISAPIPAQTVRVPLFDRRAQKAIGELPAGIAAKSMSLIGELCAGDASTWRGVKRLEGLTDIWSARAGIHHRVLFRPVDDTLEVLDVLARESLDTAIARYR